MEAGQKSGRGGTVEHDAAGDHPAFFEYDATAPLQPEELGVEERNAVLVHDVSYVGVAGQRYAAYWMVPPGRDRFPAVVYVHPSPGN